MEENLKQLLLKDLCARLPYGVMVYEEWEYQNPGVKERTKKEEDHVMKCYDLASIETIKPYLRPMSSMTEEEKEELKEEHKKDERIYIEVIERLASGDEYAKGTAVPHFAVDWCNKYHFDFRGLIPMGLALEAPEGMYKND